MSKLKTDLQLFKEITGSRLIIIKHRVRNHCKSREFASASFFLFITGIFVLFIYDTHTHVENIHIQSKSIKVLSHTNYYIGLSKYDFDQSKKILLLNPLNGEKTWGMPEGNRYFEERQCRVRNCFLSSNIDLLGLDRQNQYDAILVNLDSVTQDHLKELPKHRNPNARYVAYIGSPDVPDNDELNGTLENAFNWTMGYMNKADLPAPNGYILHTKPHKVMSFHKQRLGFKHYFDSNLDMGQIKNKTSAKLVAWETADCNSLTHHRKQFVTFLQNFIDVDVIGSCDKHDHNHMSKQDIADKYKFVLVLEEHMCKGMVGKDFFSYMSLPIVPVVFGGANYKHVAPDFSYIDANQFKNAHDLAHYLKYLDGNFDAYMEYFSWKSKHRVMPGLLPLCGLCEMLNANLPRKGYPKLSEWVDEVSHCTKGIEMPFMVSSLYQEVQEKQHAARIEEAKIDYELKLKVKVFQKELTDLQSETMANSQNTKENMEKNQGASNRDKVNLKSVIGEHDKAEDNDIDSQDLLGLIHNEHSDEDANKSPEKQSFADRMRQKFHRPPKVKEPTLQSSLKNDISKTKKYLEDNFNRNTHRHGHHRDKKKSTEAPTDFDNDNKKVANITDELSDDVQPWEQKPIKYQHRPSSGHKSPHVIQDPATKVFHGKDKAEPDNVADLANALSKDIDNLLHQLKDEGASEEGNESNNNLEVVAINITKEESVGGPSFLSSLWSSVKDKTVGILGGGGSKYFDANPEPSPSDGLDVENLGINEIDNVIDKDDQENQNDTEIERDDSATVPLKANGTSFWSRFKNKTSGILGGGGYQYFDDNLGPSDTHHINSADMGDDHLNNKGDADDHQDNRDSNQVDRDHVNFNPLLPGFHPLGGLEQESSTAASGDSTTGKVALPVSQQQPQDQDDNNEDIARVVEAESDPNADNVDVKDMDMESLLVKLAEVNPFAPPQGITGNPTSTSAVTDAPSAAIVQQQMIPSDKDPGSFLAMANEFEQTDFGTTRKPEKILLSPALSLAPGVKLHPDFELIKPIDQIQLSDEEPVSQDDTEESESEINSVESDQDQVSQDNDYGDIVENKDPEPESKTRLKSSPRFKVDSDYVYKSPNKEHEAYLREVAKHSKKIDKKLRKNSFSSPWDRFRSSRKSSRRRY